MSDEDDPLVALCQQRVGAMLSGKWRLDALIGVGGMAAVYASSHRNGARAAIKILHAEYAGHPEVRARFLREAYIANKVDHSGTVKVLDDDVSEGGEPYLVMELLTGTSVESRAQRNGGWLRYAEVLSIVEQTLAVLERAHAVGIVHRDLKPDNLFISSKGEVKVLDFGIARLHDAATSKRTQTGMMMGTPSYMAPEQALGRWPQVDGRTDLWSVGAIFFSLLSGRSVHEGQTDNEVLIRAATRPAPSLARVVPSAPVEVVRVVDRALNFEQNNRFADATAMRAAVRQLMATAGVAPWGGGGGNAAPRAPAPTTAGPAPEVRVPTAITQQAPPSQAPQQPTQASRSQPTQAAPPSQVSPASRAPQPAHSQTARTAPERTSVVPPPSDVPTRPSRPAQKPSIAPVVPSRPPQPVSTTHVAGRMAGVAEQGSLAPALPAEPPVPFGPETVGPSTRVRPTERRRDEEAFEADYATDEDIAAMKELFQEVERALVTRVQYGPTHPETRRRADRAFRLAASALMHSEYGLVWNVTPYGFVARDETLWEPSAPFDRIPYQLFADGVRLLGLLGGLTDHEFESFFELLTVDRTQVAPEDDFATLLWDAGFRSVVHQVIDTYADGDQAQRVRFEQGREQVLALANFDTTEQLTDAWQERQQAKVRSGMGAKQRSILAVLSGGPVDTEAAARAAELQIAGRDDAGPIDAAALHVDDAVRTMLAARLSMETSGLSERFAIAIARAYEEGAERDGATSVTTPLRFAIDGLAKDTPRLAIEMVGTFCREVGKTRQPADADRLRASLTGAIVSAKMLDSVLKGAQSLDEHREMFLEGLHMIFGYCDGTYFQTVLEHIGAMPDADIRDVLTDYLARHGVGHEAEMGKLFDTADLELGLSLVRVLAATKTAAAREAISHAAHSPHPVVRIEALGHVEGVSSERLRLELRALLEDREPGVRLAALKAMETHNIRVAGPFLVLRVRSPEFHDLNAEERRQAFQTLAALAPNRAESVALEAVKDRKLVSTNAHETTREVAVEILGRLGTTQESYEVLVELSTARFRNSDRVRVAAAKALEVFTARAQQAATKAAAPASVRPAAARAGASKPGNTAGSPAAGRPGATAPGAARPGGSVPGAARPGGTAPGAGRPGGSVPGAAKQAPSSPPGAVKPGGSAPGTGKGIR